MIANQLSASHNCIINTDMHNFLKLIISLSILLLTPTAHAGPWQNFGAEFQSFLTKMDDLKGTAQKEYAIDQLSKLHRDIYSIERHQQYLILMIENPGMIDINLSASIKALRIKANAARSKLKKIGKKVSMLSKQTNKLQKQLYRSAYSKKVWPSKIRKVDIPDYHLEHYLLTEGKSAYQITHNTRKELETFLKTH